MLPFEPHETVPTTGLIVLSCAVAIGVREPPAAGAALAGTFAMVGAGALGLKPVGKSHSASVCPHKPVPGGGALLTVSVAAALWPVSVVSMKRWFVVLTSDPVAVGVTFTLMTQLLFAARVPFANEIELDPAEAVNVGAPQPVAVALGEAATTRLAGRLSTKL